MRLARASCEREPLACRRRPGRAPSSQEGRQGPLVAEFAFLRVTTVRDQLPGPRVWAMFRRSLDNSPELKFYLSNVPPTGDQRELVRISGRRWLWLGTALLCFVLALGPYLDIGSIRIRLPYTLVHVLLGNQYHTPMRFATPGVFALAMFVSLTLDRALSNLQSFDFAQDRPPTSNFQLQASNFHRRRAIALMHA